MNTCKITLRDDCGNSPKNEFVQTLTVAFVTGNADLVSASVTDDVRWDIVGVAPITGKAAVLAVFGNPNREPITELVVDKVITHGKAGSVNGTFVLSEDRGGGKFRSKHYAFCYVYEFANAKATSIKEIMSYIILTS